MSFAIRFLPVDPRDPSPALYLNASHKAPIARLTSLCCDFWLGTAGHAERICMLWAPLLDLCRRYRLRADIVPLAVALADCGDVEPRP